MDETIDYLYDIPTSEAGVLRTLAEASNQAYNLFNSNSPTKPCVEKVTAPAGYEYCQSWSGIDEIFGKDKQEEVYGAVFRSLDDPSHYIYAFRGTASGLDVLDDLGAEMKDFVAFDQSISIPKDVKVEAGFDDVYRSAKNKTPSMQMQLFELVDQLNASENPIKSLWVTGHSLGAALCQLFSLDLALSRPEITSLNINYASPRVGNAEFVDFFERSSAKNTLRVQNTHDKVPCVPPTLLGYRHTSRALLIAFYKEGLMGKLDYLDCHSIVNYLAVINRDIEAQKTSSALGKLSVKENGETLVLPKAEPADIGRIF